MAESQQQHKTGWFARWRERRRARALRASEIHRRTREAQWKDIERGFKSGGGGGG
jgi:hypothetical protein